MSDDFLKSYPMLKEYAKPLKGLNRALIGREKEVQRVIEGLLRPELCNVLLLGEAGTGKTALVSGVMEQDEARIYLEIDLARMIADLKDPNAMAARLKALFNEAERFYQKEETELVLFIDEFHQVVSLSYAAVEALKPLLADSGARGIRLIAATTYVEFDQHVASNQALVERLNRINIPETSRDVTVKILMSLAKRYGVSTFPRIEILLDQIYDYTNRYIPSNSQPRKSVLVFDAILGKYHAGGAPFDEHLLADVLLESVGVRVAIKIDTATIRDRLDARVIGQRMATKVVDDSLQVAIAATGESGKPLASFLFTGATGVGKTELAKAMSEIIFDSHRNLLKFDMSDYQSEASLDRFRDAVTLKVWQMPYAIILFDEIEKASQSAILLMLQLLDEGRLVNKNNREISFANAYIVATTNIGSTVYAQMAAYTEGIADTGLLMKEYMKLIRAELLSAKDEKFPPEFLNRFDHVVPFNTLGEQVLLEICHKQLRAYAHRVYRRHKIQVLFKDDEENSVMGYLIFEGIDKSTDAGGARGVKRRIKNEIEPLVSRILNEHPYPQTKKIGVLVEGKVAYKDKTARISEACLVAKILNS